MSPKEREGMDNSFKSVFQQCCERKKNKKVLKEIHVIVWRSWELSGYIRIALTCIKPEIVGTKSAVGHFTLTQKSSLKIESKFKEYKQIKMKMGHK